MFKKITKLLSSLRFTIVLICLLGAMFIVGLWIPQKDLLKDIYIQWYKNSPRLVAILDFFQLTSIYRSWFTITLWIGFFTNLSMVLWQRLPVVLKRIELENSRIVSPETAPGYPFKGSYQLPEGVDGSALLKRLAGRGFTLIGNESGFFGVKNRYSPLAFMLFHISFYLILLGGVIAFYSQFFGYVDLAQNEPFNGELYQYNQVPMPQLPRIGSIPKVSFTIQSIVPHVVQNTPTGIDIALIDKDGGKHSVDINKPYTTDSASFVFKHLGVAPLFVLKDPSGKEIAGSYFKLNVVNGKEDTFKLGEFTFRVHFFPDYEVQNGTPATKSQEFNNPKFLVLAERNAKKVSMATIAKNGSMDVGGYRLEMRDMPFWVRFYVVRQRGLSVIFTGFFIASVAIIWRLIFFRREIVGSVRERDGRQYLVVAGRSEFYKSLAIDEFAKMLSEIAGNRIEEH